MNPVTIFKDDDGNFWCEGKPVPNLPHLYTEEEVADYLGVTIHTVRYWRKHGKVEYIKVEGQVRFTHQSIVDLIRDRTVEAWGRVELPGDSPFASDVA